MHMHMHVHVQRNRGVVHTSFTEANTGRPRCKVPAFFGLTPPTMLVPYSMACSLWKVPVLPVKPWQITLVCLKTAGGGTLACEPEAQRRVLSAGREVDACVLAAPRTDICLENCRSANAPCLFAANMVDGLPVECGALSASQSSEEGITRGFG